MVGCNKYLSHLRNVRCVICDHAKLFPDATYCKELPDKSVFSNHYQLFKSLAKPVLTIYMRKENRNTYLKIWSTSEYLSQEYQKAASFIHYLRNHWVQLLKSKSCEGHFMFACKYGVNRTSFHCKYDNQSQNHIYTASFRKRINPQRSVHTRYQLKLSVVSEFVCSKCLTALTGNIESFIRIACVQHH